MTKEKNSKLRSIVLSKQIKATTLKLKVLQAKLKKIN